MVWMQKKAHKQKPTSRGAMARVGVYRMRGGGRRRMVSLMALRLILCDTMFLPVAASYRASFPKADVSRLEREPGTRYS